MMSPQLLKKSLIFKICLFLICFAQVSFSQSSNSGLKIYQKNMHLFSEKKFNLAKDIDRFHDADDFWSELRSSFSIAHYEHTPQVRQKIDWFMHHQNYLYQSMKRASPYLYFIFHQIKIRNLPPELALLPIIESAYDPFAINSSSGAAGIWQMMPGTAQGYGIKQNWWYDGRRDVVASTKAALNYLSYLESFFDGNWLLAIAAYDTGQGNVLSAIRRSIRNGKRTDFWSLPLAQETHDYVPKLLALATILSHPREYPITLPSVKNAPYLAQVDIGEQIDLKHAAYLAGLELKELMKYNPGFNHLATDPNGPHKLVLPIENVQRFTENLSNSPIYRNVKWMHYTSKQGDTFGTIAKHFNTTTDTLKKLNPRIAMANLKNGTHLIIPKHTINAYNAVLASEQHFMKPSENAWVSQASTSKRLSDSIVAAFQRKNNYKLKPGDTLYMVRKGDSLSKIAERYKVETKTLASLNHLNPTDYLAEGKNLIIPTHQSTAQKKESKSYIYHVQEGDNLEKIAKKFHTTANRIRLINFLANNELQKGDQLIIPSRV